MWYEFNDQTGPYWMMLWGTMIVLYALKPTLVYLWKYYVKKERDNLNL